MTRHATSRRLDRERANGESSNQGPAGDPFGRYLLGLSITALGVVYGDIGTSPMYALRQSFLGEGGVAATAPNVLGVLSLVFWSLTLVISIKYLTFLLRADNRGEGGILALTSLVTPVGALRGGRWVLISLGLFATALLYGDGMITPAISVLSAVEGLGVATPIFDDWIVPTTIVILIGLFGFQRHGTAKVGRVFGPITIVWFLTIAALGLRQIIAEPGVVMAVSPHHAVRFFLSNGWQGFVVLGSVVLVVTGGEALYADMGHFGPRAIRLGWFTFVLPALLLNYFGQGALILRNPAAADNPFFRMAPAWAVYPLVGLSAVAAVIASQALISGSFSVTRQAVQLGYAPRLDIDHTSAEEMGQIYVPAVNRTMMLACIGLVIGFGSSSNLAAAYGVAVTLTMAVTSLLFFVVARERWKWKLPVVILVAGVFFAVDLAFVSANLLKVPHGGWFPIAVGVLVFTLLTTWKRGRRILAERMKAQSMPREVFLESIRRNPPVRVPGTAIYMYSNPGATPPALLHNLKHNKVLHERVVFLSMVTEQVPFVPRAERATIEPLDNGIYQVVLHYGFMEDPDVPKALMQIRHDELQFKALETTYFLGRETLIATAKKHGMALWRERLFAVMTRNATNAALFFRLPPNQVVELGAQIEI